jgi:hypothetical protein
MDIRRLWHEDEVCTPVHKSESSDIMKLLGTPATQKSLLRLSVLPTPLVDRDREPLGGFLSNVMVRNFMKTDDPYKI